MVKIDAWSIMSSSRKSLDQEKDARRGCGLRSSSTASTTVSIDSRSKLQTGSRSPTSSPFRRIFGAADTGCNSRSSLRPDGVDTTSRSSHQSSPRSSMSPRTFNVHELPILIEDPWSDILAREIDGSFSPRLHREDDRRTTSGSDLSSSIKDLPSVKELPISLEEDPMDDIIFFANLGVSSPRLASPLITPRNQSPRSNKLQPVIEGGMDEILVKALEGDQSPRLVLPSMARLQPELESVRELPVPTEDPMDDIMLAALAGVLSPRLSPRPSMSPRVFDLLPPVTENALKDIIFAAEEGSVSPRLYIPPRQLYLSQPELSVLAEEDSEPIKACSYPRVNHSKYLLDARRGDDLVVLYSDGEWCYGSNLRTKKEGAFMLQWTNKVDFDARCHPDKFHDAVVEWDNLRDADKLRRRKRSHKTSDRFTGLESQDESSDSDSEQHEACSEQPVKIG